jgi:hypothetical protein
MVTLVIVRLVVPVLVTLKPFVGLVVPTFCTVVKVNGEGGVIATAGPGGIAVPVKVMVRGLPLSESDTTIVAVRVPVEVAEGLNLIVSVQTALAANEPGQPFVS